MVCTRLYPSGLCRAVKTNVLMSEISVEQLTPWLPSGLLGNIFWTHFDGCSITHKTPQLSIVTGHGKFMKPKNFLFAYIKSSLFLQSTRCRGVTHLKMSQNHILLVGPPTPIFWLTSQTRLKFFSQLFWLHQRLSIKNPNNAELHLLSIVWIPQKDTKIH